MVAQLFRLAAIATMAWAFGYAPVHAATVAREDGPGLLSLLEPVIAVDAAYAVGWSAMYARLEAARTRDAGWEKAIAKIRQLPLAQGLARVNRIVNLWHRAEDPELWGEGDYWATPREVQSRGGDCEDFAIAKFFMLLDAGIPSAQMAVVVLRPKSVGAAHAVLVVESDVGPIVLDNLRSEPYLFTRRLSVRMAYAVNDTTMWIPRALKDALRSKLPSIAGDTGQ